MAKFYAYNENVPLGEEKCGSDGKLIIEDLKTVNAVIRRCINSNWKVFRIYSFTNFYDQSTFKLVHKRRR